MIAGIVLMPLVATSARAEVLDGVFAFRSDNISHGPCDPFGYNCQPAPVDPVEGSFRIDVNSADANTVGPVSDFVSNLPGVTGPFSYIMEGPANPTLVIGNDCDLAAMTCSAAAGRSDLILIYSLFEPPYARSITYTLASDPSTAYGAPNLTLTQVPEPASIMLAGMGWLAALAVMRRRKA